MLFHRPEAGCCGRREESRIAVALFQALNAFLLANGPDVSGRAAELHAHAHAYVARAWRGARDARLREALAVYLRAQLLLGGLEGGARPGDLADVRAALEHSMQQPGFRWWGPPCG